MTLHDVTIYVDSLLPVPNFGFMTMGLGMIFGICPSEVVDLTQKLQGLVSKHCFSFYRPRRDKKLSEPCLNQRTSLGLVWQRSALTTELSGVMTLM